LYSFLVSGLLTAGLRDVTDHSVILLRNQYELACQRPRGTEWVEVMKPAVSACLPASDRLALLCNDITSSLLTRSVYDDDAWPEATNVSHQRTTERRPWVPWPSPSSVGPARATKRNLGARCNV